MMIDVDGKVRVEAALKSKEAEDTVEKVVDDI